MLKQITALPLCALAALCLAVAADSKPEAPRMIAPKPLDPAMEVKLLRATSSLQAASSNARAFIAEQQQRMFLDAQFQKLQATEREASAARDAALEEARKACGASPDCDYTPDGRWVRYERTPDGSVKQNACLIPEPPKEPKK